MVGFLLSILLSVGAINALIPLALILILIVAAAGATRGYSLFNIFGMATLAGIGLGAGGMKGKTAMGRFFLFRTYSGQAGRLRKIPKSKVKSLAPAALVGRIHQFGAKVFSKGSDFAAMHRRVSSEVKVPSSSSSPRLPRKQIRMSLGPSAQKAIDSKRLSRASATALKKAGYIPNSKTRRFVSASIPATGISTRSQRGMASGKPSYINLYGEKLHPTLEGFKKKARELPFAAPFVVTARMLSVTTKALIAANNPVYAAMLAAAPMPGRAAPGKASDGTMTILHRGTFSGPKSTGKLNTTNWQRDKTRVEDLRDTAKKLLDQVKVVKSVQEAYRRERETLKDRLIQSHVSELQKTIDAAATEAAQLKPNDPKLTGINARLSELKKEYDVLTRLQLESRSARVEADKYIMQYARRVSLTEFAGDMRSHSLSAWYTIAQAVSSNTLISAQTMNALRTSSPTVPVMEVIRGERQTDAARFLELTSRLKGMEGRRVISDKTEAALVAAVHTLNTAADAEYSAVSKLITAERTHQSAIAQIHANLSAGEIEKQDADAQIREVDITLRRVSDDAMNEFHKINRQFEDRTTFFGILSRTERHPITALLDNTSSQFASAGVKTWNAWPALGSTISTFYKAPLEGQPADIQSDLQKFEYINDNRGFSQDLLVYYLNKFGPKRASRSNK